MILALKRSVPSISIFLLPPNVFFLKPFFSSISNTCADLLLFFQGLPVLIFEPSNVTKTLFLLVHTSKILRYAEKVKYENKHLSIKLTFHFPYIISNQSLTNIYIMHFSCSMDSSQPSIYSGWLPCFQLVNLGGCWYDPLLQEH